MIYYTSGLKCLLCNVLRMSGSVFPTCFFIALPPAIIAATLHYMIEHDAVNFVIPEQIMSQSQAWSGFTSLVGFLIVFRTSQAYSRWWEGCSASFRMRADFLDAASSTIAFCKASQAPPSEIAKFKNIFVRIMSLLHASALAEVEEVTDGFGMPDQRYDLLDPEGLSMECLTALRDADCKVELLFTWVQQLLLEYMNAGVLSVPPPILSRVFQELAQGMVHFQTAVKLSSIPFPFVYAQACDFLLIFHWIVSPIIASQWVQTSFWAGTLSFIQVQTSFWAGALAFIQVFTLWALNTIATGIENPFGSDAMDLDGSRMQREMNGWLRMFLLPSVQVTPTLTEERLDEILQDPNLAENIERTSVRLSTSRHFHTLLAQESSNRTSQTSFAPSSVSLEPPVGKMGSDGFYRSESEIEIKESEKTIHSDGNDWKAAIRKAQADLQQLEVSLHNVSKVEVVDAFAALSPRSKMILSAGRSNSSVSLGTSSAPLAFGPLNSDAERAIGIRRQFSPHGFQRVVEEVVWESSERSPRSEPKNSNSMVRMSSEPTKPSPGGIRRKIVPSRYHVDSEDQLPGSETFEAPPRIRGTAGAPALLLPESRTVI